MNRTSRMVQHLFQQREWTDRQDMGIQQQTRQWVDQTFPCWWGPALHHSSLPSRRPSIIQHWWTLCHCGRCFNVAWTCPVFQITPSVRLSSHHYLLPDMTQPTGDQPRRLDLQKEDPSLQRGSSIRLRDPSVLSSDGPRRPRDKPGLPWDHPGRPWDKSGTTASPGNQDHAPHSPDPLQWSLQHEMSLHSTQVLTQCSVGLGFQESHFGGRGCWEWQQDLCSTIWNLQASCHYFEGIVQGQPCQD